MKIIPDLDSIIIEYQIDDKEKLLEALKKNVVGYSKHWRYNKLTRKLKKNPEIFQDTLYSGKLYPHNYYRWVYSPAKIVFLQNSLFEEQPFLRIKIKPSITFFGNIIILFIFFFALLSAFISIIKSIPADNYRIFLFFIPVVIFLIAIIFIEKERYDYSRNRALIINTFEMFMYENGIKFKKLKETRQKPWFIRKLTKKPEEVEY